MESAIYGQHGPRKSDLLAVQEALSKHRRRGDYEQPFICLSIKRMRYQRSPSRDETWNTDLWPTSCRYFPHLTHTSVMISLFNDVANGTDGDFPCSDTYQLLHRHRGCHNLQDLGHPHPATGPPA